MKEILTNLFPGLCLILFLGMGSTAQNIFPSTGSAGIGTLTPNPNALLDMVSTTQGVLVPRMTKTQRDNIASPAVSLLIYQTNSNAGFYYFNGTAWNPVSASAGANKTLSNLGVTSINMSMQPKTTASLDLGSNALNWRDLYLSGKIYQGSVPVMNLTPDNSAIGYNALASNTSGTLNVAIGSNTLSANTTGYQNTAVGDSCLPVSTTGFYLTAVGFGALKNNTTGMRNAAYGFGALGYNTTGKSNAAMGTHAMFNNTSGSDNTALGTFALEDNTTGDNNVAIGKSCMVHCTSAGGNVAIGNHSLYSNTANYNQVAIGDSSLSFAEGGTGQNTAVGGRTAFNNTVGSSNSYFGYFSGNTNVTGNQLTLIGTLTDVSSSALSNSSAIGYSTVVTTNNSMRFGNGSVTFWGFGANAASGKALIVGTSSSNGNGAYCTTGGAWTNTSARALKENFSVPVKQDILQKINGLLINKWMYKGTENEYHIGPVAEDFYKAFNVGVDAQSISTIDPAGVALIGIQALSEEHTDLKDAVAELKTENDRLLADNALLKSQLTAIAERMDLMEHSLSACCPIYQNEIASGTQSENTTTARLDQNLPNPYDQNTVIHIYLPGGSNDGHLIVSDVNGNPVKDVKLQCIGNCEIILSAGMLAPGAYSYSLMIGGRIVATRKMEIVR